LNLAINFESPNLATSCHLGLAIMFNDVK
jgi:hypothetical protein